MSITFAVDTYSGGCRRISWICTRPSFRSFLSCARLTRMSLARRRASIRWSSERSGACAWVLGDTIERASLTTRCAASSRDARPFVGAREHVVDAGDGKSRTLFDELCANARRRVGIGKEDGAERDVRRTCGDELDDVSAVPHAAHADDRRTRRAIARMD